ncbi:hypothetical protein [Maricaulis sp.]|nr:hypothetical protein [Maricaulis sp.]
MRRRFDPTIAIFVTAVLATAYAAWLLGGNEPLGLSAAVHAGELIAR